MTIASRLQEALVVPMTISGAELVITISTGIALPTPGGDDAAALLRNADAAMYRAKQGGRSRAVVFADAMRVEALGRLETETQLRRALAQDELRVYYQPMLDLGSGALVGMEALVRWQHPTRRSRAAERLHHHRRRDRSDRAARRMGPGAGLHPVGGMAPRPPAAP